MNVSITMDELIELLRKAYTLTPNELDNWTYAARLRTPETFKQWLLENVVNVGEKI